MGVAVTIHMYPPSFAGDPTPTNQTLFLDTTPHIQELEFSTGEHGFESCTFELRLPIVKVWQMYDRPGLPHVVVADGPWILWEGRLEDVTLIPGGVRCTAMGYYRACSDFPYSQVYCLRGTASWFTMTLADRTDAYSDKYVLDTNNRLHIGLKKNETYTGGPIWTVGYLCWRAPTGSWGNPGHFTASYEMNLPVGWAMNIRTFNDSFGGDTDVFTLSGTGAVQTGTLNLTYTGQRHITLMVYTGLASTTYTGETGAVYAKLTNVQILGTTAAAIYGSDIATEALAIIRYINASAYQLNPSTALIQNPGVALEAAYEDALPSDILNEISLVGGTDGRPWEWGVAEDRALYLRPKTSIRRSWSVDVVDLEVERSLDAVQTYVFAIYQDGGTGRPHKHGYGYENTLTKARWGNLHRAVKVDVDSTDLTLANRVADTLLQDLSNPKPRASLTITALYDATGQRWPLYAIRAGDSVRLRNLPLQATSPTLDRIAEFRVAETTYNARTDSVEVVPESTLPRLETLLAQQRMRPIIIGKATPGVVTN